MLLYLQFCLSAGRQLDFTIAFARCLESIVFIAFLFGVVDSGCINVVVSVCSRYVGSLIVRGEGFNFEPPALIFFPSSSSASKFL